MKFSTKQFKWNAKSFTFSGWASDFPTNTFHPVFEPPRKINLESHITGNVIELEFTNTKTNNGDIVCWNYTTVPNSIVLVYVEIFND